MPVDDVHCFRSLVFRFAAANRYRGLCKQIRPSDCIGKDELPVAYPTPEAVEDAQCQRRINSLLLMPFLLISAAQLAGGQADTRGCGWNHELPPD